MSKWNCTAIKVFNMIFEWLLHLCGPHIQLFAMSLSRAVNFKHRFTKKSREVFQCLTKKGTEADVECPLWSYWLHFVSLNPVTTKTQASVLTQLPERKETAQGFQHEANGEFKTVTEFNGCDRRKLRMDQQHCSYATIYQPKWQKACTE
jgi:hypothetical protein